MKTEDHARRLVKRYVAEVLQTGMFEISEMRAYLASNARVQLRLVIEEDSPTVLAILTDASSHETSAGERKHARWPQIEECMGFWYHALPGLVVGPDKYWDGERWYFELPLPLALFMRTEECARVLTNAVSLATAMFDVLNDVLAGESPVEAYLGAVTTPHAEQVAS
jgi:hypothetical protein